MVSFLSLLALAATAAALKITSPSKDDEWRTGSEQTIKWDAVSSDQDTFNIYLSNMASYPSTTILLASDVSSADGSYTIDGSKLTKGNSYTINFTNGTESSQIYAQSEQFDITEGTSATPTSSGSKTAASAPPGSTLTASPSDHTSTPTSGSDASKNGTGTSSAATHTPSSGAGKVAAGWMGAAFAVAAVAL